MIGDGVPPIRVLVATNGSWFATVALERLLRRTSGRYAYLVIVTTGLRERSGNRVAAAFRLLTTWGVSYFLYKLSVNFLPRVVARVSERGQSIESVCRDLGIRSDSVRNLNAPDAMGLIRDFKADVLVSFSCPHRLSAEVLDAPSIGALNVHSSLLPSYAGLATYVHCLANGDAETGVTVHEMVDQFDAGVIVKQRPIAIQPGMSVFQLFLAQCLAGADLLEEAIDEAARLGRIEGTPQDLRDRSYFGEPTRDEIRRLRRNGFRLMRRADLRRLLARRVSDRPAG